MEADQNVYSGLIRLHILHRAVEGLIFGLGMAEPARPGYKANAGTLHSLLPSKWIVAGLSPNASWKTSGVERLREARPKTADLTLAIQGARNIESQALSEYMRVLRVFADLVVHGKLPPEDAGGNTKQ
jgi:hypothetical protein